MITETLVCMALNIYHEARSESRIAQLAVGQVVMNRVYSNKYPNDVCDVVYQAQLDTRGNPRKYSCAFSWYCDYKSDTPRDLKAYEEAMNNATIVMNGWTGSYLEGATHYHATYVLPRWAEHMTKVTQIDEHIFYRDDSHVK
jgi:spore germination cell wall hydrolase CwlJ-like protein